MERFETVVVGGGQSGLAVAYHLRKRDRQSVILDANERIGDSWRRRWDSLRLYSPARYDGLPGMPFPAPPHAFPTAGEMGDYLEAYAARFDLPVRTGVGVDGVSKHGGRYLVTSGAGRFEADNVVLASGGFQSPAVPAFASELDPGITQLHSRDYRSLAQLQEGAVLVVGAAHSGFDIAFEVAADHPTLLSGRDTGQLPFRIESRTGRAAHRVMWLLATRVLTVNNPIGRKAGSYVRAHGGPAIRVKRADLLARGAERVLARTVGVAGGLPLLEGGRVAEVTNVIWCTGFRNDFSWIDPPVAAMEDGFPRQERGVVPFRTGLYIVGLPFLHSFSSMLVGGVGRDAEHIAKHIDSRTNGERAPTRRTTIR
jgi:putative flavoprotein involved in K+ transport